MKESTLNALWVAGAAAVSLVGFLLIGTILGGHPFGWDIHVVLASAVFAVILGTASTLLWSIWRKRQDAKAGYPAKDERTRLLEGRAGYYTVLVLGYFLVALLWYNLLSVDLLDLPALSGTQLLIASILANTALFAGFRWYFLRGREGA